MKLVSKSNDELLADIDELGKKATELSLDVSDYSTFLLLKCIEVNEDGNLDRLAEIFDTFLVMKEYMFNEHKKEQESRGYGQAGRKGETRQ